VNTSWLVLGPVAYAFLPFEIINPTRKKDQKYMARILKAFVEKFEEGCCLLMLLND